MGCWAIGRSDCRRLYEYVSVYRSERLPLHSTRPFSILLGQGHCAGPAPSNPVRLR